MATIDIAGIRSKRPNVNSFAEDRLNPPAESWAPPLAPNGTTAAEYVPLREDTFRPEIGEDPFQPPAPSSTYEAFPSRRTLIAGTAIIAALAVAVLAYFFLASPGAEVPAETTEASPIAVQSSSGIAAQSSSGTPEPSSPPKVESSSETPVQPAPSVFEPSRGASGVVPSPDVAASLPAEATPQAAPSAVAPPDLVFLQRPGVNIRSAPAGNAPVLGTAPKGTQFTATGREGDWVRVESTRIKGWISSQFLAPNKPQ
jgi:SH3 domain-containing protein